MSNERLQTKEVTSQLELDMGKWSANRETILQGPAGSNIENNHTRARGDVLSDTNWQSLADSRNEHVSIPP
jgi:hypothetical protein